MIQAALLAVAPAEGPNSFTHLPTFVSTRDFALTSAIPSSYTSQILAAGYRPAEDCGFRRHH